MIAALLASCGGGSSDVSTSDVRTIPLWSPGVDAAGVTRDGYGCGAGTIWLPLKWGRVPKGTKELVLYFGRYENEGGTRRVKVTFSALLVALKPKLRGLPANTYPPGAFIVDYNALNSCPATLRGQHLLVALFARPRAGQVPVGTLSKAFAYTLTEDALGVSPQHSESMAAEKFTDGSLAVGQFTATVGSG
jgi:hypothetical protein